VSDRRYLSEESMALLEKMDHDVSSEEVKKANSELVA
jgi:hypothetical protein